MNRPVHFEILVPDPASTAEFYESVFGWTVARWDDPDPDAEQGYYLLETGDPEHPGIDGAVMHDHFDQRVINTIEVENLDASIRAVREAGGEVINGLNEVPGVGTHAYYQDPAGVIFGMMQPGADS